MDIAGNSVEYLDTGAGQPVVLLHSTGASGAQWRALIERLAARFRVIAPDLCGYGATSGWSGRGPFTLAHEAMLVGALLDRFDEPIHLVGHSYGGAVALHLARTQGERLRSLTLYEPVAFHLLRTADADDEAALGEISAVAAAVVRSLASGDLAEGAGRFIDYWSGPGAWAAMPPARQAAFATRLAKVALDFHAAMGEPASLRDVERIAVPTLLLHGDRSPRSTRRICQRLAQALPDVTVATVHGAGHMAPLTHAGEVNDRIAVHLEASAALALTD
ncbi:MAG TPA: alpha/beta fold hydrolase [Albitalea sp.]|uniref:alpha/beta fold hydrolase n=1 Tax=Piscinibacter sp. TaxID=1903157 RepID=UPI002ED3E3DA